MFRAVSRSYAAVFSLGGGGGVEIHFREVHETRKMVPHVVRRVYSNVGYMRHACVQLFAY